MVYIKHKNEEEKRLERMIVEREKEVMKIYFGKYILLYRYIILTSRIGK